MLYTYILYEHARDLGMNGTGLQKPDAKIPTTLARGLSCLLLCIYTCVCTYIYICIYIYIHIYIYIIHIIIMTIILILMISIIMITII